MEVTEKLPTQHDVSKSNIDLVNAPELKDLFASGDLEKLDEMEAAELNIATQYYDFELGKKVRFAFLGITEQPTTEGEMLPAIVLMDKEKNTYTNMGAILVSTFINQNIPVGTFVELAWIGSKKTTNGFTARTWSVRPLTIKS